MRGIFFKITFSLFLCSFSSAVFAQDYQVSEIKHVPLIQEMDLMNVKTSLMPVLVPQGISHESPNENYVIPPVNELPTFIEPGDENSLNKTTGAVETPSVFKSFYGGADGRYTPPDNSIAVSNDGYIISAMNSNYRIFKPGTTVGIYSSFYDLFKTQFPNMKGTFYDPRVIYDPKADRYILVVLQGSKSDSSFVVILMSKTNNPADGWNFYSIPGDLLNTSYWFDYPTIAISDDELFITGNLFNDSKDFVQSVIVQVDKVKGYNGDPLAYKVWSSIKDASNTFAFSLTPVNYDMWGMESKGIYIISNLKGTDNKLNIYNITGNMNTTDLKMSRFSVPYTFTYSLPGYSLQLNGKDQNGNQQLLNMGDTRIKNGVKVGNIIHYVFSTKASTGYSAVVYGRYNISNSELTTQVIGKDKFNYCYPTIESVGMTSNDQNFIISFMQSGATTYPGILMLHADANFQFSTLQSVQNGVSAVNILSNTSYERWGDYTTLARRYNSNSCILASSYGTSNLWGTKIAEVGLNSTKLSIGEEEFDSELSIYPNPAPEYFTVDFEVNERLPLTITLYDMQGKSVAVLYNDYVRKIGPQSFFFNTTGLSNGIYTLEVASNGTSLISRKIVKN